MASSDTEICNMALGHLMVDNDISELSTERSLEARSCRKYYETVRSQVLRDFPWPFAKRLVTLALVEEDPSDEWAYSYRYPSDCLMLRRILSGTRNDSRDTRVPYLETGDDTGKLIYTDMEDAVMEYTKRITDVQVYPDDFVMMLTLRLSAVIAPQVTGGDPFKLGVQALQKYMMELRLARGNAASEEQPEENSEAEWIRGR